MAELRLGWKGQVKVRVVCRGKREEPEAQRRTRFVFRCHPFRLSSTCLHSPSLRSFRCRCRRRTGRIVARRLRGRRPYPPQVKVIARLSRAPPPVGQLQRRIPRDTVMANPTFPRLQILAKLLLGRSLAREE